MDYNNSDYEIIQTSSASWAIQYRNGPQIGGFNSRALAAETASETLRTAPVVRVSLETQPRTLDDAVAAAALARHNYREFLQANPNATEDQLADRVDDITLADAHVSDFLLQQSAARSVASASLDLTELSRDQRITLADRMRTQRAQEALALRTSGATQTQMDQADQLAFDSELYYQNTVNAEQVETLTPTSFFDNVFSSVSSTVGSVGSSFSNLGNLLNTGVQNEYNSFTAGLSSMFGGGGGTNTQGSVSPIQLPNSNLNPNLSGSTSTQGNTGSSDMRVRLSPKPALRDRILTGVMEPLKETGGMLFPYTPNIVYQGAVTYNQLATVHANQDWHIYSSTPSVQLSIDGVFTAQNKKEAEYYLACIHFLRVMSKMHFGESEKDKGLPPPQALLDGYGTYMFNGLSVIVTNFSVGLPNNVDYVDVNIAGGTASVPVMSNLVVQLVVQQTPAKAMTFDWDKFANGELMQQKGWL